MKGRAANGFTLLELMLAVAILAAVTAVTYLSFSTVVTAWKRGTALADDLAHGDFVVEQVVMGLRSAYYVTGAGAAKFGFLFEDNGEGDTAADKISWVKLGTSLVGRECPFAGSPHRVELLVEDDEEGRPCVAVRAWRLDGQPEDFDPESVPATILSRKVHGLDCRLAVEVGENEIEWLDEWEDTNRLPRIVEVTLYMDSLEKGEPAVEVKRLLEIPAAELSWTGGGGRSGGRVQLTDPKAKQGDKEPEKGPAPATGGP